MDCVIVEVEQGTDKWLNLRRGRLTASRAGDWLARPTTRRYQDYMEQVVMELLGYEEEEDDAPWFEHGKAMEPFARGAYEWKTDQELTSDIFLIHKEHDWLAASPDGVFLPDYDGMVEFKCRAKLETYHKVLANQQRTGQIESAYRPQVQCQMLVSGLTSIEFGNYYHDNEQRVRKLDIFPVAADETLQSKILEKGLEFIVECYKRADVYDQKMRPKT